MDRTDSTLPLTEPLLKLLTDRLDRQDQLTNGLFDGVERKLDQIHKEVKLTNARVTSLENRNLVADALVKATAARKVRKTDKMRFRVNALLIGGGSCLGAAVGGAGHALHWW